MTPVYSQSAQGGNSDVCNNKGYSDNLPGRETAFVVYEMCRAKCLTHWIPLHNID